MDTKWLTSRLEARGETVASLARAVGRDRAAMSRIVNGDQPLQLWMTPIIAEKLGVSEVEVLSRAGELKLPPVQNVPIIPWHAVGAFAMTTAPVVVAANYERTVVSLESDTLIALRIGDDAMSALYPAGSVVIVDYSQKDLQDADVGVFALGDRSALRRYRIERKRPYLVTESLYDDGVEEPVGEVVGRVVAAPLISRAA